MTGQSRRRLAAGEARDGGGARDRRSGDHSGGGDHGSEARAHAHPVEHAEGCGGGGARRSRAQGGGRSSATCGRGVVVHGSGDGGFLRAPGVTRNTGTRAEGTGLGSCHRGAMAGGEGLTGAVAS